MDITVIKDKIAFSKDRPHKEVISDIEKAKTVLICLEAGQSVGRHISKSEIALFALEGKGSFIIDGKENNVEKGSIVVCEGNKSHDMKAESRMVVLQVIAK